MLNHIINIISMLKIKNKILVLVLSLKAQI